MFQYLFIALAIAAQVAFSQSPPGFNPAISTHLSIKFGNIDVNPAGVTLQKADVSNAPAVDLGEMTTNAAGALVAMVDFSVQVSGASGNSTLVHWVQPDFSLQTHPLGTKAAALAPYIPPNPPAGQTHTYGIFLYAQTEAAFKVPSDFEAIFQNITASSQNRRGFDLGKFAASANLGQPLAATYFLVGTPSNTTSSATTSTTPASASSTGSTSPTPTSGASSSLYVKEILWLGAALTCVINVL